VNGERRACVTLVGKMKLDDGLKGIIIIALDYD